MNDLPLRVAFQRIIPDLKAMALMLDADETHAVETSVAEAQAPHLMWMLDQCLVHLMEWPSDKIGRWLGFVQGVLATRGIMDCVVERDRTRPIFHEAYDAMGLNKPKTIEGPAGSVR